MCYKYYILYNTSLGCVYSTCILVSVWIASDPAGVTSMHGDTCIYALYMVPV